MNFLAHVYLANSNPQSIVGQLCGDFVRGTDLSRFPEAVAHGIRIHRAVDSFTDKHPLNLQARELFKKPYRRFAGIIADVAYDHYLALDWATYSNMPLPDYAALVDQSLASHYAVLPTNLQRFTGYLKDGQILQRNTDRAHIELTLARISQRRKSLAPLATAAPELWRHNDLLKEIFDEFFPLLVSYTESLQRNISNKSVKHVTAQSPG